MLWNRGKKRSQRISLLCERIRGPYNFFIRKAQGKSSRWIRDFLSDSGRISRGEIEFRVYILHIMEETKLEMKELVR